MISAFNPQQPLTEAQWQQLLDEWIKNTRPGRRVLLLPPDYSRCFSYCGVLCSALYQRLKAAGLGFVECGIWGLVISTIIGTLGDNLLLLLFYCFGYAAGLFLGSTLEGKIALGTSNLQLIANDEKTGDIIEYLRSKNRGYTVFDGQGSVDKMNMVFIVLPHKEVKRTLKEIRELCEGKVFVVASDVSKYAGGYGMVK